VAATKNLLLILLDSNPLPYLCQPNGGKAFWITVIVLMLMLGAYWTASIYISWQEQPVMTTASTTALPISKIEFPSVTICAHGETLLRGFFDIFRH
jgi:hypothetical protein